MLPPFSRTSPIFPFAIQRNLTSSDKLLDFKLGLVRTVLPGLLGVSQPHRGNGMAGETGTVLEHTGLRSNPDFPLTRKSQNLSVPISLCVK